MVVLNQDNLSLSSPAVRSLCGDPIKEGAPGICISVVTQKERGCGIFPHLLKCFSFSVPSFLALMSHLVGSRKGAPGVVHPFILQGGNRNYFAESHPVSNGVYALFSSFSV